MKIRRRLLLLVSLLTLFSLLVPGNIAAAGSDEINRVELVTGSTSLNPGNTFTVYIKIKNVEDDFGIQFTLSHSDGLTMVEDVVFSPPYSLVARTGNTFALINWDATKDRKAEETVGSIVFRAAAEGTQSVTVSGIKVLGSDDSLKETNLTKSSSLKINVVKPPGTEEPGPGQPSQPPKDEPPPPKEPSPQDGTEEPSPQDGSVELTPKLQGTATAVCGISENVMNKLLETAKEETGGKKRVSINVNEVKGGDKYITEFPASVFTPGEEGYAIGLNTPLANLNISSSILKQQQLEEASKISITLSRVDTSDFPGVLNGRPGVTVGIQVDGKDIDWENKDVPLEIEIPYTPTPEESENPEFIVVMLVDEDGNMHPVPSGRYCSETGTVKFTSTKPGTYVIAYYRKTFDDMKDARGELKQAVEALASRGIIQAVDGNNYVPEKPITRGEFLLYLIRALNLTTDIDDNFDDVKESDDYYEAVGIAKKLGITKGVGNNRFAPEKPLSRQDMMVLIARAFKVMGLMSDEVDESVLDKFGDKDKIAEYARESIAYLIREGIIKGTGAGLVKPEGQFTRDQVALVLYRLYKMIMGE